MESLLGSFQIKQWIAFNPMSYLFTQIASLFWRTSTFNFMKRTAMLTMKAWCLPGMACPWLTLMGIGIHHTLKKVELMLTFFVPRKLNLRITLPPFNKGFSLDLSLKQEKSHKNNSYLSGAASPVSSSRPRVSVSDLQCRCCCSHFHMVETRLRKESDSRTITLLEKTVIFLRYV